MKDVTASTPGDLWKNYANARTTNKFGISRFSRYNYYGVHSVFTALNNLKTTIPRIVPAAGRVSFELRTCRRSDNRT